MVDQWFRRDPAVNSHCAAIQGEDPKTRVADAAVGFEWQRIELPLRDPVVWMALHVFHDLLIRAWLCDSGNSDVFTYATKDWFPFCIAGNDRRRHAQHAGAALRLSRKSLLASD